MALAEMRELRRVGLDALATAVRGSAYLRLPVLPPLLRVAQVTDAELSRETSDLWFGAPGWEDPPDHDSEPDDDGDDGVPPIARTGVLPLGGIHLTPWGTWEWRPW